MKRLMTLRRERVNRALDNLFYYPMIIVEAPIGYGKTTAVREFLAARDSHVMWLSFLSPEDNAALFWDKLADQIGKLDRNAGDRMRSLGFPEDAPQTARILSLLNEIEFEENTVLVIDDYHLVKGRLVGALLKQIVQEEPENLHIIVITRDTSNLELGELLAKGLCSIFHQQALLLNGKELREYCHILGFRAEEDTLKKIEEYTGGWISLVYLILLGLEYGVPIGRNNAIDDLVENVLYNAYDDSIRSFLRQLSVMDSFTAAQARYVTGESRTEELLRRLRRENAFIAYDEAADIYRIHNVLLDFLRAKQMDDEERSSLYKRVGEWYLDQKAYLTAYGYLFRAGERTRILEWLDHPENVTIELAEFDGAAELFSTTPGEVLAKYPIAYLQYIALLLISGDPSAVQDGTERLEELKVFYEKTENIEESRRRRILGEISTIRVFSVFNDAEKMAACTFEALRLFDGDTSWLMHRDGEFTLGSPHFLYTYYRAPGKLRETVDRMVTDFPAYSRLANGCGAGCEYVALAEYALETGDWEAAELNARKALYRVRKAEQSGLAICAVLSLIRLHIYRGEIRESLYELGQLREVVLRENNAIYNTTLDLVEGYVQACLGRLSGVPEWLRTGDMSHAHFMFQGIAFNYIVYGKSVLLTKNFIELEMLSGMFTAYFSYFNNQLGFLHNQIFDAIAKFRLYGPEQGFASLRKALNMARADHIILPFAEYAPFISGMLRRLAAEDPHDLYIREVLDATEQYAGSLKHAPQSTVSLSSREREVLSLTAEGYNRNEIARQLGISPGTVKTHLENIYHKLEANGKLMAIKKARDLKIL